MAVLSPNNTNQRESLKPTTSQHQSHHLAVHACSGIAVPITAMKAAATPAAGIAYDVAWAYVAG
jgi:hypothetical protein